MGPGGGWRCQQPKKGPKPEKYSRKIHKIYTCPKLWPIEEKKIERGLKKKKESSTVLVLPSLGFEIVKILVS